MNKKSTITIAIIAIIAIAIGTVVGSKAILGDSKIKLPGEDSTENALHLQESSNTAKVQSNSTQTSANTESTESGP